MKQRLLFEGELRDRDLENVLPTLISKAVEIDDDVFLRWNGATIRVEQTDTIDTLMQKYDKGIRLVGLANKMEMPADGRDEMKKQLLTRQPQSPVFVSAYDIANYDGPETEPDNAGLMTITAQHGDTPKGYRCPDIEAFYLWEPNGPGKGFAQSLMCRFHGSEPHFNHMLRFMCSREAEYIILLPRPKEPFLFFGGSMTDIEIERRSVEHQTFVMKYGHCIEPLPYYDGPLDIEDCTEPELMKKIY